ncbi:GNAT family N-acetyltransferase [Paenibacillus sp. CF384]|uniref:GNAT family N-acetyltransferase n=1 Tax=Paenibacillus sp. CF384 TaxID=1884382 RepID=UPI0008979130|nr:GNAT family N-acetyltransferase [Paenibacillus sp. CF384]SDW16109.1 Acetyltransferase (GNAT) domain-containing protein [Paenibacillus sp. CF384]
MNTAITVLRRVPTLSEYKHLCQEVGWNDYMNFDVAEESLSRSLFGVVIEDQGKPIGMGRVVGDGRIYFYIQDIVVLPGYQNQGIGKMIMETIKQFLEEHAPEKAFVGLFASQGKESFYTKYGFQNHDGMTGMFGVIHNGRLS